MKILFFAIMFVFPVVAMILLIIWFLGSRKSDLSFSEQLIYLNGVIDNLPVSDDNFRFINAKFAEINRCNERNHKDMEEAFKKFCYKYSEINTKLVKEYLQII